MTTPEATPSPLAPAAEEMPDGRGERRWSNRIYLFVALSFVLWVALMLVLQGTFS